MPSQSFCTICQHFTSRYHERQHRKSSLISSSNTSLAAPSTFVVVESGSESEVDEPDSASNPVLDGTSTGVDIDYPVSTDLTEIRENAAHLREWLHIYPPISIYDSECGEDRESWMKSHEQAESAFLADEVYLAEDNNVAQDLNGKRNQVEIEEVDHDSDSDFWGSDESFLSEGSDFGEESTPEVDWDVFEQATAGVSAFDRLNEEFEAETANIRKRLSDLDLAICRAYAWKLRSHTADEHYKTASDAFGPRAGDPLPNLHAQRGRLSFLSGFRPQEYHCCVNSCVSFAGVYANIQQCPYCKESRYNAAGSPRKVFTYIPLIPRLQALYGNRAMAQKMGYRLRRDGKSNADNVEDIFDGQHYRRLLDEVVRIGETSYERKYFVDSREVALGLSTDGFAPFKRRSKTAWPIILINYNLPPDVRCHLEHIISLGVIPGPSKPQNWDSFIWPLMEELALLASDRGVPTLDILQSTLFPLRAHLIAAFGDIPAVAMVMRMKGHNGKCPCRLCSIEALPIPGGKTNYVPLDRSSHPDVQADDSKTKQYDPRNLPLRTPAEFLAQAAEVDRQATKAAKERLSKRYGIKGTPMLSMLGSLSFPISQPYDFMHLIFENLLPNLVLHWTGEFKGMDDGSEDYELANAVWQAIGSDTAKAGDTIPSAYGGRVPNIATKKSEMNAERWSFWALYIAPIVLRRRFIKARYYKHFVKLVRLINMCLQFEISSEEIDELEEGFSQWVEEYERIYYQYDPERLPTCPLTVHAILHIAQSIRDMGPVWCYWAFVMERYCGTLTPDIKSRRFPFASLDRNVLERAQLTQIGLVYDVGGEFNSRRKPGLQNGAFQNAIHYPDFRLLPPRVKQQPPLNLIQHAIAPSLATRFGTTVTNVRSALTYATIEQYGALKRIDSEEGDTIRCASLYKPPRDSRDPTFTRYEMYVDIFARKKNVRSQYKLETFYGQLEHIFVIRFENPDHPSLRKLLTVEEDDSLQHLYILAGCRRCTLVKGSPELDNLDIHLYSNTGPLDVVDITAVQCLVGRVPDTEQKWAIIDRSGALARAIAEEGKGE